jgi:hypothetical protein
MSLAEVSTLLHLINSDAAIISATKTYIDSSRISIFTIARQKYLGYYLVSIMMLLTVYDTTLLIFFVDI